MENLSPHQKNQQFQCCKFCRFVTTDVQRYANHCRKYALRKKDQQSLSLLKKRKINMVVKNKILSKIIVKKEYDQCTFVARNPAELQKHRLTHLLFGTTIGEYVSPLAPTLPVEQPNKTQPAKAS